MKKVGLKIFFTGAIRGGRINQPQYMDIIEILRKYGLVLSEHVADEYLSKYGETDLEKEEVHNREIEALNESDVIIAEVTTPSLGVGYLIAQAINLNKKVIVLYRGEDMLKLSAMIKGNKNIKVCLYNSLKDLDTIFSSLLN